jgi:endonuclease/exonuclease/phosphatase family metal-dependent hydrolase
MSYNLRLFQYTDRDRDGQDDDFKPESEIAAVVALIASVQPDVLAVQEIGDAAALDLLRNRLATAGVDYPHLNLLENSSGFANLAVLSRLPITSSESLTNLAYSVQGEILAVQRGFQQLDLAAPHGFTLRLINAHLKSKRFHPLGQTEMRRNEARLLATHVRGLLRSNPDLPILVCGDLNDDKTSAALRELIPEPLTDLPVADRHGDRWTHYYAREDAYNRIDYLLASPALVTRWVEEKSGILRDPATYAASDHRPIIAVFRAK